MLILGLNTERSYLVDTAGRVGWGWGRRETRETTGHIPLNPAAGSCGYLACLELIVAVKLLSDNLDVYRSCHGILLTDWCSVFESVCLCSRKGGISSVKICSRIGYPSENVFVLWNVFPL